MEFPKELIERLAKAKKVAVLTGAGVSAESGIKTFRDPDGLWTKMNPAELASMDGFMKNPKLVWDWYQYRREIINSCKPNAGHYALAEMETMFPDFTLITQNVDRLHQQAGSKNVWELHGNIIENKCSLCFEPYLTEIKAEDKELPVCVHCGGKIRPNVVWFGEMLPERAINHADFKSRDSDVFFSIGTSAEVYPAAQLPVMAQRSGAYVIEINPNRTAISNYMSHRIESPSAVALPLLLDALKKYLGE